jgi:multiple sugar transport system permease protein
MFDMSRQASSERVRLLLSLAEQARHRAARQDGRGDIGGGRRGIVGARQRQDGGRAAHAFPVLSRIRSATAYHLPRLAVALLFVLPLIWVVSFSLRKTGLPPSRSIVWVPDPVAWENYARIFDMMPLVTFLGNSLLVAAMAVPVTLLTASLAAFAVAQSTRRFRERMVLVCVLLMLVPVTALWLTRYILFAKLGLIDTVWSLVAPAIMGSSPLFVLLYFWSFRRIPADQFEAARLDGASFVGLWLHVAMPQARAATVTVTVLAFIFYWSDFFSPLLYLKSEELYTLPVALQLMQQMDKTNWPLLMAGATFLTAPIVVMFLAVQRHFWPDESKGEAKAALTA